MAIITCACGQKMRVPDQTGGQRYKCPKCGQMVASGEPAVPRVTAAAPPLAQPLGGQARRRETRPEVEREAAPSTSGLAITSLIMGLCSLLCPPIGLLGVVFGLVALFSISSSQGRKTGSGLAIAGCLLS